MDLEKSYLAYRDKFPRLNTFVARSAYEKCAPLLGEMDEDGIAAVLREIDHLLLMWTYPEIFEEHDIPHSPKRRPSDEDFDFYSTSHVAQIYYLRNSDDVRKFLTVTDKAWPSWFAAMALGHLAESMLKVEEVANPSDDSYPRDNAIKAAEHLAYAVEAVGYAERLSYRESEIGEQVRAEIRSRNAKAGKLRHAGVDAIKTAFVAFYKTRSHLSGAEGARRFYAALPDQKKRLLSPQNYVRTLVQSLRE